MCLASLRIRTDNGVGKPHLQHTPERCTTGERGETRAKEGLPADINVTTLLQKLPHVVSFTLEVMGDILLFGLITTKRRVQLGQRLGLVHMFLKFVAIKKVVILFLTAKEKQAIPKLFAI